MINYESLSNVTGVSMIDNDAIVVVDPSSVKACSKNERVIYDLVTKRKAIINIKDTIKHIFIVEHFNKLIIKLEVSKTLAEHNIVPISQSEVDKVMSENIEFFI